MIEKVKTVRVLSSDLIDQKSFCSLGSLMLRLDLLSYITGKNTNTITEKKT